MEAHCPVANSTPPLEDEPPGTYTGTLSMITPPLEDESPILVANSTPPIKDNLRTLTNNIPYLCNKRKKMYYILEEDEELSALKNLGQRSKEVAVHMTKMYKRSFNTGDINRRYNISKNYCDKDEVIKGLKRQNLLE